MEIRRTAGTRVGDWVLEAPLGTGATGEVWRARCTSGAPDERAVIKIAHGPAQATDLVRGARAQMRIESRYVVRVFEVVAQDGEAYAVYEPCLGGTLRDRLERGPLHRDELVAVFNAVLRGLAAAHRKDRLHLDIKPENVLRTESGRWKVTDFGGFRAESNRDQLLNSLSFRSQSACVTPRYMAPELRRNAQALPAADIYSCGIMWFECACGALPSALELPSERRPDCPWWVDALFRRLAGPPERRFEHAQAALGWAIWHINGWPARSAAAKRSPFRRDLREQPQRAITLRERSSSQAVRDRSEFDILRISPTDPPSHQPHTSSGTPNSDESEGLKGLLLLGAAIWALFAGC